MNYRTTLAALALTATLAACSTEPPISNEEAVPQIFETAFGKTPSGMLEQIAGNYYSTFEIAKGLGGDRAEGWDEARFNSELAEAFAPLADQINSAFSRSVAQDMGEGEGQEMLALLSQGKNAEYAACVFDIAAKQSAGDPLQTCADDLGIEASQELQDGLGNLARRTSDAIQNSEVLSIAAGYATCKVLAKFGEEVSTDTISLSMATTRIGLGGNERACSEYDAVAAEVLSGEITPNFPASDDAAADEDEAQAEAAE